MCRQSLQRRSRANPTTGDKSRAQGHERQIIFYPRHGRFRGGRSGKNLDLVAEHFRRECARCRAALSQRLIVERNHRRARGREGALDVG